jgi:hypothetical protein
MEGDGDLLPGKAETLSIERPPFVAGGFETPTYHYSAERSEARERPHFEAEKESKKADLSIGL